jgi:hypothetical protein
MTIYAPLQINLKLTMGWLILVTARSKAWIYGCLYAGIAGSNPAGGVDICLLNIVCCQVEIIASG